MSVDRMHVSFGAARGKPNAGYVLQSDAGGDICHLSFTEKETFGEEHKVQVQGALREAVETTLNMYSPDTISLNTPHIEHSGLAIGRLPPSVRDAVAGRIEAVNQIPHAMHTVLKGFSSCELARDWVVNHEVPLEPPYEAYVDASFLHDLSHGSIGYVVVDRTGTIALLRACPVGTQPTSHTTEVVGVRLVLNDVARTLGPATPVLVHTDCSYVLDKLKKPTNGRRPKLLEGIRTYIDEYSVGVDHVPRDHTALADTLATFGRDHSYAYVDTRLDASELSAATLF